jgi:hypothetical protein
MEQPTDISVMTPRISSSRRTRLARRRHLSVAMPARLICTLAIATALSLPVFGIPQMVQAQETAVDGNQPATGRFEIREHGVGFVRLDRQTGELSYCTIGESGLACRIAAEEREAYQQALAEFEERLARLEKQSTGNDSGVTGTTRSKRQDRFVPDAAPPSDPETGPDTGTAERELDRAMNLAERAMQRFFAVIREWQRDLGGEGSPQ